MNAVVQRRTLAEELTELVAACNSQARNDRELVAALIPHLLVAFAGPMGHMRGVFALIDECRPRNVPAPAPVILVKSPPAPPVAPPRVECWRFGTCGKYAERERFYQTGTPWRPVCAEHSAGAMPLGELRPLSIGARL